MFKGSWNQKLSKLLIWLAGYVSFIAFAIVGGYTLVKIDDEELKLTTKRVFVVSLVYYALLGFMSILTHFGSMNSGYYGSGFYEFCSVTISLIEIIKIIFFAVCMLLVMFKDKIMSKLKNTTKNDTDENQEVEAQIVEKDDEVNDDETISL